MDRRSTNPVGYTHYTGDVTAGVDSSHGVRLTGGSTGGILESVGDDTNITLTVRAQGAGQVVVGSTANTVRVGNSRRPRVIRPLPQTPPSGMVKPKATAPWSQVSRMPLVPPVRTRRLRETPRIWAPTASNLA